MNQKKLIVTAAALAVLAIVAVMQRSGKNGPAKQGGETTLLQDIDLNAIDKIELSENTNSVTLVKKDGIWVVSSLHEYPVNFDKLARALRALSAVEMPSPQRAANIDEAEFGLGEPAKGLTLKAAEKELIDIKIGARREAGSSAGGWANQMFISIGDEAIYLVDYDFRPFSGSSSDWIKRDLISERPEDIVALKSGNLELKADAGTWTLVGLDSENEELQQSVADNLRRALQFLNCSDIANPAKSDEELGFDQAESFSATTRSGIVYSLQLGKETGSGRYVRIAASYEKPKPPVKPEEEDQQEQYEAERATYEAAVASNTAKVAELTKKLSNWTYVINSYNANNMTTTREQLVKDKPKESPPPKDPPLPPER